MEQYLVTSYTFNNKLYLTNLISNYKVKEIYSTKTLHIHGSCYTKGIYDYQNIKFKKLEKIKSKAILYGDFYKTFYKSEFVGDISNWDTSSIINMCNMFYNSKFTGDISKWDTSSVISMTCMFWNSQFNGVISNWDVSSVIYMGSMFYNCPVKRPAWYMILR